MIDTNIVEGITSMNHMLLEIHLDDTVAPIRYVTSHHEAKRLLNDLEQIGTIKVPKYILDYSTYGDRGAEELTDIAPYAMRAYSFYDECVNNNRIRLITEDGSYAIDLKSNVKGCARSKLIYASKEHIKQNIDVYFEAGMTIVGEYDIVDGKERPVSKRIVEHI